MEPSKITYLVQAIQLIAVNLGRRLTVYWYRKNMDVVEKNCLELNYSKSLIPFSIGRIWQSERNTLMTEQHKMKSVSYMKH